MNKKSQNSLQINFNQVDHTINLDGIDYICLNDLAKFFPEKRVNNWMRLDTTQEFIKATEKYIQEKSDDSHVSHHFSKGVYFIVKGNYEDGLKQGTYAHRYVAIEFLTWLSPEFKLLVITQWDAWRLEKVQNTDISSTKKLEKKLYKLQQYIEETFAKKEELDETDDALEHALTVLGTIFAKRRDEIDETLKKYEIRIQILEKSVKNEDNQSHKVYILYKETTDEYKIGRSQTPWTRKRQFQTVEPELTVLFILELGSAKEAGTLERFLHEKFSHKKTHGEWFKLDEKDLNFIEMLKIHIQDLN